MFGCWENTLLHAGFHRRSKALYRNPSYYPKVWKLGPRGFVTFPRSHLKSTLDPKLSLPFFLFVSYFVQVTLFLLWTIRVRSNLRHRFSVLKSRCVWSLLKVRRWTWHRHSFRGRTLFYCVQEVGSGWALATDGHERDFNLSSCFLLLMNPLCHLHPL